jgi:hypothetical protein
MFLDLLENVVTLNLKLYCQFSIVPRFVNPQLFLSRRVNHDSFIASTNRFCAAYRTSDSSPFTILLVRFAVTSDTINKLATGLGCTDEERDELLQTFGRVPGEIESKFSESQPAARLF